jgi:hypothetical protein
MKSFRLLSAVGVAGAMLLRGPAMAQDAPKAEKPSYVGAEACGKCHKSEAKGNQLSDWKASKHAGAYAVLATPEAKKVAQAKGVADPQKDAKCLRCHVTAHGVDAALIVKTTASGEAGFKTEDGVQCESCHGPGSLYKSLKVMKDMKAAMAAGMTMPDEKVCKQCHNADSPNYKPFNYQEMLKKVAHPNPAKAKG